MSHCPPSRSAVYRAVTAAVTDAVRAELAASGTMATAQQTHAHMSQEAKLDTTSGRGQAAEPTPAPASTESLSVDMGSAEEEEEEGEDCFYVNRPQFIQAAQMLMKYGRVVLLGPPGSGKSYLAHALIKFFRQKDYHPKVGLKFCDPCLKNLNKEGGGPKRIVLMELGFDQLRAGKPLTSDFSSFFYNTLTLLNGRRDWNALLVVTIYPHLLTDIENLEHGHNHDEKLLTHPQVILRLTRDPRHPTLPFVPGVATLMPFLTRLLRGPSTGNVFSCLLALSLEGFTTFSYRPPETQAELKRLGYGTSLGCQELDHISITLQDVLFDRAEGGFINRGVYDACALALALTGGADLMLRVVDARFLVEHVRLDGQAEASPTTLVVRRAYQRSLAMERMCQLIEKNGGSKELPQHPSFVYPEVAEEFFQHCGRKEGLTLQLMTVGDADFNLPLLYWSLWAPSSLLTQWCMNALEKMVVKDTDLLETVLSSLVACVLVRAPGEGLLLSLKEFVKKLHKFNFKHPAAVLNLTLPFPWCSTAAVRAKVDEVRARVESGLCYLNNPEFPVPRQLLSFSVAEDSVTMTMSTEGWYLTLRLLTDTEKDETDPALNTVQHLAASAGDDGEVLAMIAKSGASLTAKNKKGQTAKELDDKRKKSREPQQQLLQQQQQRQHQQLQNRQELHQLRNQVQQESHSNAAREGGGPKPRPTRGATDEFKDSAKNTALHMACREGRAETVSLLLQLRANANAQNSERQTPLWLASATGHGDVVVILTDHGVNVRLPDCHLSSPLHEASRRGFTDIVQQLMRCGADVNGEDKRGVTPLFLASAAGYADIVRLLLKQVYVQVNLNRAPEGRTPLHVACDGGHSEVVSLLLQKGADVSLKDAHGLSSADIVRRQGLQGPVFEQVLAAST